MQPLKKIHERSKDEIKNIWLYDFRGNFWMKVFLQKIKINDLPFLANDNFLHITYYYVAIAVINKFVPILDLYICNVLKCTLWL